MSTNKEMIEEIRQKLNVVNQSLIDPDKFENADQEEIKDIYNYVSMKDSFTPSETAAIADSLGQLRD
ncbi:DUF1128 family protein [Staphylococcus marylandisciuri]